MTSVPRVPFGISFIVYSGLPSHSQITPFSSSVCLNDLEMRATLFDTMNEEKDYLQIFDLKVSNGKQLIHHYQEQPQWSEEVFLLTDNPITEKVYIITENGNETMLLAEDY